MWRQQRLEKLNIISLPLQNNRSCTGRANIYSQPRKTLSLCAPNLKMSNTDWWMSTKVVGRGRKVELCEWSGGLPSHLPHSDATNSSWMFCSVFKRTQQSHRPGNTSLMQQPPQRMRPKPVPRLEEARPMTGNRITWSSVHVIKASWSEPSDPPRGVKFLCGGAEAGRVGTVCGSWTGLNLSSDRSPEWKQMWR